MKKILAALLVCIAISCGSDDSISDITLDNLTLEKEFLFIEESTNLNFEVSGQDNISVTSSNGEISIEKITKTNYKISASEAVTGKILVTISNEDPEKTVIETLNINFLEHGTKDYQLFEGITIKSDTSDGVKLLHGEPEGLSGINTNSSGTKFQNWYYFSKGFYFTIITKSSNPNFINLVTTAHIFGFSPWSARLDSGQIKRDGITYPHNIAELGNLNTLSGILMDKVIEKHNEPEEKSSLETSTFKWYRYSDLAPTIIARKGATFFFNSDDINEYTGKRISSISLF